METPNKLAAYLLSVFAQKESLINSQEGMRVNPIVSELATWYERIRNAMEYRDEDVVLRAAIARILKRRHFYGGNGKTIAAPLMRELTWARYFPDGSITDQMITQVEDTIGLYLILRKGVLDRHLLPESEMNDLSYHLISSHLTYLLNPNKKRDTMANFMFHVMKDSIILDDDTETARDVQVFIAVRRAFMKDDIALLQYHLFIQYFGIVTPKSIQNIVDNFSQGYAEIKQQLSYPLRHKFYAYIKRATAPFLVLEEVLLRNESSLPQFVQTADKLNESISMICKEKYASIRSKVNRAIIRSLIFLFITKAIIALSVEGTFESIVYGQVAWFTIALNIIIPPIILATASVFIRTPGNNNTEKISSSIHTLLFNDNPQFSRTVHFQKTTRSKKSALSVIFSILWVSAFFLSFGLVVLLLNQLHFNIISQIIFVFFLAVVSFLIHRISQTAHTYTVSRSQHFFTPIIDFFFMPIARVGRYITEGVAQVNIFLIIIDLLIEAPFKGLFSFFEQWFMFLHSKREYLD
jgi:hypothetical protein